MGVSVLTLSFYVWPPVSPTIIFLAHSFYLAQFQVLLILKYSPLTSQEKH